MADYEALTEHWRVFKKHRPAGAYHPVGQLDGDCRECGSEWPCPPVREVLDKALGIPELEANYHEAVVNVGRLTKSKSALVAKVKRLEDALATPNLHWTDQQKRVAEYARRAEAAGELARLVDEWATRAGTAENKINEALKVLRVQAPNSAAVKILEG